MRGCIIALCACAGAASGQAGLPDQCSPWLEADTGTPPTQFNVSPTGFTWQQQFVAAREGELSTVVVGTFGDAGEDFTLALRAGAAWSTSAELFSTKVTQGQSFTLETHVIDLTAASISANTGDVFVLEARGDGVSPARAVQILGSTGTPALYNQPLFFNGSAFTNPALRIGFRLYIDPECAADLTGEGDVNTNDFFAFLGLYQAGDCRADYTGNGSVDTNDFFAYLAAYQASC